MDWFREIITQLGNLLHCGIDIELNIWSVSLEEFHGMMVLRATLHMSQEPWPWNGESPNESVQRPSQDTFQNQRFERLEWNMIHLMPCRLYIHLAFTYSVSPSSVVWRELGPTPPFSTNESAWSVMVTCSQSRVWSDPNVQNIFLLSLPLARLSDPSSN